MKWFGFAFRGVAVLALALAAVVAPVLQSPAHAGTGSTWFVQVGGESGDQAIQVDFFRTPSITISAGDKVTWTWVPINEIHTVSFLGAGVPQDPFSPSGGDTVSSSTTVNSGVRVKGAPSYTLNFPTAGDYTYHCLVHPSMKGVVHVLPAGQPLVHDQGWYDQQATVLLRTQLAMSRGLKMRGLAMAIAAGPGNATVGAGVSEPAKSGILSAMRFLPSYITVKQGEVLTFTNGDPEVPHTVSFNYDDKSALPGMTPVGYTPGQVAVINTQTDSVNSGWLANAPLGGFTIQGKDFKVKFTSPGVYNFHCEIHDQQGMKGTVVVTP